MGRYDAILEALRESVIRPEPPLPESCIIIMRANPFRAPHTHPKTAHDIRNSLALDSPATAPYITRVVYNNPATIVWWSDGVKTVVRCSEEDTYSPETGLAMAICKRVFGNDGKLNKVFERWLPHDEV